MIYVRRIDSDGSTVPMLVNMLHILYAMPTGNNYTLLFMENREQIIITTPFETFRECAVQ